MKQKLYLTSIAFLVFTKLGISQMSTSLLVFDDLPQNTFENPAQVNNAEWTLSLPILAGVSTNFYTPLTFNQIGTVENDTLLNLNFDRLSKKISSMRSINQSLTIPIVTFTISKKKHQYSFAWMEKQNLSIYANNDLFELINHGNSNYIGQNSLTPKAGIFFNSYHELTVGYAFQKNRKLTFGGHAKLLLGSYNLQSRNSKAWLQTNADLKEQQIGIDAKYNVSGIPFYTNNSSIDSIGFSQLKAGFYSPKNIGIAFDLGFTHKIDRLSKISIALNNIGVIRWSNHSLNYSANGNYVWDGINLDEVLNNHASFNEITDDIRNSFINSLAISLREKSYFSLVNPDILIHYSKKLSSQTELSIINRTTLFHNRIKNDLSLVGKYQFNKFWAASTSYSIINRSFLNLGAALYSNHRKFDFYLGTNNLLWFIANANFRATSLTLGCNLKLQNIIDPLYLSLMKKRKLSYKRQKNWYHFD